MASIDRGERGRSHRFHAWVNWPVNRDGPFPCPLAICFPAGLRCRPAPPPNSPAAGPDNAPGPLSGGDISRSRKVEEREMGVGSPGLATRFRPCPAPRAKPSPGVAIPVSSATPWRCLAWRIRVSWRRHPGGPRSKRPTRNIGRPQHGHFGGGNASASFNSGSRQSSSARRRSSLAEAAEASQP